MTTTIITNTPAWIIDILEEEKHKEELAAMITEVEAELANKTRAIIPKKPFK
jgi:phenylpyruvate tautomerase PptA (4-oxalocrotonate tautomerase family)